MAFDENQAVARRSDWNDGAGPPKNMTPNWAKVAADLDSSQSVVPGSGGQAQSLPVRPTARPSERMTEAAPLVSSVGNGNGNGGGNSSGSSVGSNIDMVLDIPVQLSVELGRTKLPIKQILELKPGSVVELDSVSGEPIDVLVNGYLIAQGEIVVVNGKFGIRLTDVVTPSERFKRFGKA